MVNESSYFENEVGQSQSLNVDEEEEDDLEEIHYHAKDHNQKFAFNYNRSSCLSDNNPHLTFDVDNAYSVAPGEESFQVIYQTRKIGTQRPSYVYHPPPGRSIIFVKNTCLSCLYFFKI